MSLLDIKPNVVTPNPVDKIWLFYGELATRKTSVAASFPGHIIFAFDIGYKFINGACAQPMQSWAQFRQAVRELDNPKVKEKYKTVVVDTAGMAYQACYDYMLSQMGIDEPSQKPYGMGWKMIRNEFETVLRSITQKGYGLILIGHAKEQEIEDAVTKTVSVKTKIDIDSTPSEIIKCMSDFVFYLRKEPIEGTTENTVYAYTDLVQISTKKRARYFSPKFEFTYENLKAELNNAVTKQYEQEGIQIPDFSGINQLDYYKAEEEPWDVILNKTKDLAIELTNRSEELSIKVQDILLKNFEGKKLSELTEDKLNRQKLSLCYEALIDLK